MKTIKFILINLISFAVLLALINWGCGLYLKSIDKKAQRENLPNYSSDHAYATKVFHDYNSIQHQYEPFVGWRCKPYKGETTTVGEHGFRIHPASNKTTTSETKTAWFFGGSTMWGEGSDDNHTIPALFNKDLPEYQVKNFGQLAYNSRQELDALISSYSKGDRANLVIFYDGVNDAAFLCPKEISELPAHRLVPMYRDKLYTGKAKLAKEIVAKIFFDNILTLVYRNQRQSESPYDCVSNPKKAEQIAEIMMRNWELAHEIVSNRGGRFMAILQPAAFIGNPQLDHLELDPDLGQNFEAVYKNFKKKIKERNHPWIFDLSDKFDGEQRIYIDFCHVSPNGNEIIAKEISRLVGTLEEE
ncbi:MAG TPA: SGNH/GDSL hydrolase family protein [Chryseosolibacter sp.]|nr:SGNH/GDSL hydrolase family protein [Chryseosolibacter sp.]